VIIIRVSVLLHPVRVLYRVRVEGARVQARLLAIISCSYMDINIRFEILDEMPTAKM
jgi:hypothetical protein